MKKVAACSSNFSLVAPSLSAGRVSPILPAVKIIKHGILTLLENGDISGWVNLFEGHL